MRFSLRWILAGTAYVALAAAAFSQRTWPYGEILWGVWSVAAMYASAIAICARGKRQILDMGFLVGSACFFLGFRSSGGQSVLAWEFVKITQPPIMSFSVLDPDQPVDDPFAELNKPPPTPEHIFAVLRAANAVATMAFGLIGSLVGLMAFRAARMNNPDRP